MSEFQVQRDQLATTRIVNQPEPDLESGEIKAKVDRFSFTANNITYGIMGDYLRYWQFFPPTVDPAADTGNWGVIPVWGFADVVESNSDEIAVGERLFGYFPPATHLTLKPGRVSPATFFDAAAHRAELPPGYNVYRRVQAETGYDPSLDAERMLLFPLLITSFCLHDMLESQDYNQAKQILILSASSKTSIGLAYALAGDKNAPAVVGVTSAKNAAKVEDLNLYDSVVSYDQLDQIDANLAAVIVDMSANRQVMGELHSRLGDNMLFTSNVGMTHWDAAIPNENVINDRCEQFFAPSHIQNRMQEWGPEVFEQRSSKFISETSAKCRSWLKMQEIDGLDGLHQIYPDVLSGNTSPERGIIVKM